MAWGLRVKLKIHIFNKKKEYSEHIILYRLRHLECKLLDVASTYDKALDDELELSINKYFLFFIPYNYVVYFRILLY